MLRAARSNFELGPRGPSSASPVILRTLSATKGTKDPRLLFRNLSGQVPDDSRQVHAVPSRVGGFDEYDLFRASLPLLVLEDMFEWITGYPDVERMAATGHPVGAIESFVHGLIVGWGGRMEWDEEQPQIPRCVRGDNVFERAGRSPSTRQEHFGKHSSTPPAWMMLPFLSSLPWQDACVLGGSNELYSLAGFDCIEWQN
jgi:hypothetical protein